MALSILMQAPTGWVGTYENPSTGSLLVPDLNGYVTVTNSNDIKPLIENGFIPLAPVTQVNVMLGMLLGANMNVTTDQIIPMFVPATKPFRVQRISVTNASISLTTAAGGFYDAASKGGNAIVAAGQAYSGLTTATKVIDLTVALLLREPAGTSLRFALTTAQGAAATADIYVVGDILAQ